MNVLPEILSTIAATKGCNTMRSKIGQDMEQQILTIIVTLKLLTLRIDTGLGHIRKDKIYLLKGPNHFNEICQILKISPS